jgi:hypothetical protein
MDNHTIIRCKFRVGRDILIHEISDSVETFYVPHLKPAIRQTGVIDIPETGRRICTVPLRVNEDPGAFYGSE